MWCCEPLRILETNKKTAGSDEKTSRYYYYPPYAFGVEYFGKQNNILLCKDPEGKGGFSLIEACKLFIKDLLRDGVEYVIIQSDIMSRRSQFCSDLLSLPLVHISPKAVCSKISGFVDESIPRERPIKSKDSLKSVSVTSNNTIN